jgi:hypothetical protein
MPVPYFPKKRLEFMFGLFRNGDTRHLSDDSGIDANSANGAPASSPAPGLGCRDSPRSQKKAAALPVASAGASRSSLPPKVVSRWFKTADLVLQLNR